MNQVVSVVRQDPLGVRKTFHADRIFAAPVQLLADLFHDRLDLLGVASATDDEEVREAGDFAQVQDANIKGLLGFGGSNGSEPRRRSDWRCNGVQGRVVLRSDS